MTTILYGGGPSLDARREFAELKGGTHVPGYRGYCPQIKYRVGKTYGKDTKELADKEVIHRKPCDPVTPRALACKILQNELPEAIGDNKYSRNMVPGYTGYIPKMPFKFGNTYKEDCDSCIDKFLTDKNAALQKTQDLKRSIKTQPRLQPVYQDPGVRDQLNRYQNTHPQRPILLDDRRGYREAPMPGYKGFCPRIYVTEQGLGCRYHEMTKNGWNTFADESQFHHRINQEPVSVDRGDTMIKMPSYTRRLYLPDGMIPKYTGYLPQRRFNFGQTYGDTSRSLDICTHNKPCFGDHLNTVRGSV